MRSNLELWEIVRDNFDRYWDGKIIDLSNAERLYEFLIKNYGE